MPRYDEIDLDSLSPEQQAVADAIAGGPRGSLRGPFVPWLLSPGMADPAQRLGAFLRFRTVVPQRLKELAILFTARRWDAGFEWSVHAKLALEAGLPRPAVEAIGRGDTPDFADDDDALIWRACREMYETRRFSDGTFAALKALLGPQGVAELAGLLGYYALVSITLNAFEVPALEDSAVPELAEIAR
ncbi:MAG: carboxymuconolactone decarboxylase family protein [Rhodospirillaceae bacterium]|nr:carboxymuconolactone decarboxylase family protein [Rhodospirillaceae bacterium]MYH37996.1 carboxymuconolactone decarboxylase family protein [Rhodospirillaceae bacterium]MYK15961.1 carboxymuconolactone decarboxylase family protein [Rhodospirillaceae bacterium]MYK60048.1 carboxymuconolactone decarboxylase family protein [Rhodospirillaceae bacterium]